MQQLKALVPDAEVVLRAHKIGWKPQPDAPTLTAFGVRVARKVGPFILKREYAAPDV
jgi:hypothetical protein